jgi:regulator of protease activity HflC (stomatin/prohibitin superfamily)
MDTFSSILGLIALVGLIGFVAGIALIVVAVSQRRNVRGGVALAILGIVVFLVFSVIASGLVIVDPTQVAIVVDSFSGQVEPPVPGGLHVIVPLVQRVALFYPITQLEYTMAAASTEGARTGDDSVSALTKDGQTVNFDITILYRVLPDQADQLYRELKDGYVDSFVRPVSRSIIREVASKYTAEEIYSTARSQIPTDLKQQVGDAFGQKHFVVDNMLVRNIVFSDTFHNAIEAKVTAEQNLEKAKIEAQTAQTQAKGLADAQIARAEGDRQSAILRAQASAQALQLVSQQITANPLLIQYLYVQNLSDKVQLVLLPSNSPFLFDMASLTSSLKAQAAQTPSTQDQNPQPESTATPTP